jgi:hypothetical protein
MRFLYPNLLTNTMIDGTGWGETMPLENVAEPNLDDYAESLSTNPVINVDFGFAVTLSGVAIAGHNITGSATVRVTNNSDYSGGDLYTIDLTSSTISDGVHYILYRAFTAGDYRYMQISITNTAEVEIGYLWVGEHLDLTPSARAGFTVNYQARDVIIESIQGRVTGDKGLTFREVTFDFPKSDKTIVKSVRKMYNELGIVTPFIFLAADDDGGVFAPMYCRFVDFAETIQLPKIEYTVTLGEGR